MEEIPITKFKPNFDKILARAYRTKQPIRIALRGKKLADILL